MENCARIVGGLGHVDMVVGMDWLLAPELAAQDLDGSIRDDLPAKIHPKRHV